MGCCGWAVYDEGDSFPFTFFHKNPFVSIFMIIFASKRFLKHRDHIMIHEIAHKIYRKP